MAITLPHSTADSLKVRNYLNELKKGSKIHIGTLAKELGVKYSVVFRQIQNNFEGKFEILEGANPWYDPKTRLPYTKDGIRFEPKLFQYYDKDGKVQNRKFWQTQTIKGGATVGEWNVLAEGKKNKKDWKKTYKFKNKEDAVKFFEDYKTKTSGEIGKLRRYLDAEIAKSGGKKLSFASMKDLNTKAKSAVTNSEVSTLLGLPKYMNRVKKFPATIMFDKPFTKIQKQSLIDAFSGEVKKWDWSYKYGVQQIGNKKLYQRMDSFLRNQGVPWRYKFNWQAPGGWMLQQMDRAATRYNNPQYESILDEAGKVIGMKDKGTAYYASRALAPSNSSKLIFSHPHFEQVQKIVDIASKAKAPLTSQTDKASKALVTLFPKGFDASALSLSRLLAYLYKDKGLEATRNAIQLHHIKPMKSLGAATDPKNIMLLRRDFNVLANTVDQLVQKGDLSRIPELKEAGVKIKVGDVAYGRGTQDPTKLLRQETEALYEPLSKFKTKDWANLDAWLKQNLKRVVRLAPGSCQAILRKQTGGIARTCIEAINKDPVGSANKLATMEATSGALGKVKNAARGFLGALGKFGPAAGKFGAIAVAGAVAKPAFDMVRQFVNDDPSTYLTDPEQMERMLLSTIEAQERKKPRSEILDWSHTAGTLGATAAAIPGSGALMRARRMKGFGLPRQALGPAMKLVSGMFTPAGLLATEPLRIAQKRREGEGWGDIAQDPTLWMGPAFADTMTRLATSGMKSKPLLSKALSLGMSRPMLKTISRKFGMPGLALSLGLTGYDKYQDWKNKEGWFAKD